MYASGFVYEKLGSRAKYAESVVSPWWDLQDPIVLDDSHTKYEYIELVEETSGGSINDSATSQKSIFHFYIRDLEDYCLPARAFLKIQYIATLSTGAPIVIGAADDSVVNNGWLY